MLADSYKCFIFLCMWIFLQDQEQVIAGITMVWAVLKQTRSCSQKETVLWTPDHFCRKALFLCVSLPLRSANSGSRSSSLPAKESLCCSLLSNSSTLKPFYCVRDSRSRILLWVPFREILFKDFFLLLLFLIYFTCKGT